MIITYRDSLNKLCSILLFYTILHAAGMATAVLVSQPGKLGPVFPTPIPHGLNEMEDIEIYVTTSGPNSSVTSLKVWSSDTIASVKMRIQASKGFYVKHQRLVYGGRELCRQDALLKDYGVTNGKMLHLVLKLSDLQVVTIETVGGKEHVFRIDRMKRVRDLKEILSIKEAGLVSGQQLVVRGQDLQDEMRIEQLPLEDDAVVHLYLRNKVKVRSQTIGEHIELSVTVPDLEVKRSATQLKEEPLAKLKPLLPANHGYNKIDHFHSKKQGARYVIPALVYGISRASIPSVLLDLILQVSGGLEHGRRPILSPEGSGGAYFMQDEFGANIVGVFKPIDEEPMALNNPRGLPVSINGEGLKRGTKVGEGALREVAAYILDHPARGQSGEKLMGFAGVPPTIMIKCLHQAFHHPKSRCDAAIKEKIGSLQLFVHASSNCEDMGPAHFPVHEVHKIAVLDIRLANTDRNGANILVCKPQESSDWTLVPIDHGYCLPDKFEDCTFEWLYWPQANIPFGPAILEYIAALDADADIALLQEHGWILPSECARVLCVGTMLLKKGAAAGLTPCEIGSMMCRKMLNKKSMVEDILEHAESSVLLASDEGRFLKVVCAVMDTYIQKILDRRAVGISSVYS